MESPKVYEGSYLRTIPGKKGNRCDSEGRIRADWKGEVGNSGMSLDAQGNTIIHLGFNEASLETELIGRDRVTCRWSGAKALFRVHVIEANFKMDPEVRDRFPDLSVEQIDIQGLRVEKISVEIFGHWTGEHKLPGILDSWIENHINELMKRFLGSELKKRLDAFLSRELERFLDDTHQPLRPFLLYTI